MFFIKFEIQKPDLTQFKQLALFLEKNPVYIHGFIILLLLPALLINLGLYPFNLDEATRAIVVLEMKFSGNFIIPSINGEFYYNKPPLFNWIQLLFVQCSGSMEEWVFRLPVVISLLGFGLTVFMTLRKELGYRVGLLATLAVITSGRILFYDSFKGLIDITFSWTIYLIFWNIYNNFSKGRILRLFVFSWFLTALGFLLKGMPSLVFQGISLVVYFIYQKSFRKLFSIQHFTGLLIFLTLVGGYLALYNHGNSLTDYVANLWNEAAIRTPIGNSFLLTISHFIAFPFNFISYFLPWSLLVFCFFSDGVIKNIWQDKFLRFLTIIFISNIFVYWISPAIYPRYLFMFLPPLFAILFYVYENNERISRISKNILKPFLYIFPLLIAMGLWFLAVRMDSPHQSHIPGKILFLSFIAVVLCGLYILFAKERIFILMGFILFGRIAFNFFIFDERLQSGIDAYQREDTIKVAVMTKGRPLYLYKDCPIHKSSTFYIERERQEILFRWKGEMEKGKQYIIPETEINKIQACKKLAVFETNLAFLNLCVVELE